jgi:hypothetical protein
MTFKVIAALKMCKLVPWQFNSEDGGSVMTRRDEEPV